MAVHGTGTPDPALGAAGLAQPDGARPRTWDRSTALSAPCASRADCLQARRLPAVFGPLAEDCARSDGQPAAVWELCRDPGPGGIRARDGVIGAAQRGDRARDPRSPGERKPGGRTTTASALVGPAPDVSGAWAMGR